MFSEASVSHFVHRGRGSAFEGGSAYMGGLPSGGLPNPHGSDIQWWPLQRSIRILLECILVTDLSGNKFQKSAIIKLFENLVTVTSTNL